MDPIPVTPDTPDDPNITPNIVIPTNGGDNIPRGGGGSSTKNTGTGGGEK